MAKALAGGLATVTIVLTVLSLVLSEEADELTGLARQVFPQRGFGGAPRLEDISAQVDLRFLDEDAALPRRFFSARWEGFWYLPETAVIELHGAGDDRLDVWIDGARVIRRTSPGEMHTQVVEVVLEAGLHELVVEYEQYGGAYSLRLEWAGEDGSPQPLPSHYLFPERVEAGEIRLVERAVSLRQLVPVLWMVLVGAGLVWVAIGVAARYRIAGAMGRARLAPDTVRAGWSVALAGGAYGFAIWVYWQDAWVAEDAYIIFRSVEQVFAGNGPVWNPHERVQAFTSPLWFGLLVLSRLVSVDLYLNALVLSFALWLFTLRNLQRVAPGSTAFVMAVLLCVTSSAVFLYTSSGLENVLAYALVTYLVLQVVRLHRHPPPQHDAIRLLTRLCLAFGLITVTRHDLVLLVLPPTLFTVWSHRRIVSARQWCVLGLAGLAPLVVWTLFSLVYYGFPWPNTAYAKLNTGIARADLVVQGFRYLQVALLQDGITLLIVLAGLTVAALRTSPVAYRFVAAGILFNLAYVVSIGGDFLLGRFLSYACIVAVCLVVSELSRRRLSVLPSALRLRSTK